MKQGKVILLGACALLMSACVSVDSTMAAWAGRSIDDVTAAWGAPNASVPRTDGGATHTWIFTIPGERGGVSHCRKTFSVNAYSQIMSWSYSPECPLYELR